jgi:hypothetical protein
MTDPGEIRWANGSVRIGYLGDSRWRVDASGEAARDERGTFELNERALIEHVVSALETVPRGAAVRIAVAPNARALDLGIVAFVAPGVHDEVRVAWRADLVGVLPRHLPNIDVVAAIRDGRARYYHTPFLDYGRNWLGFRCERCWGIGVPLPPDRLGPEFSFDAFTTAPDGAALAARLQATLGARLAASPSPEQTFYRALRELDALGHIDATSNSNPDWYIWASECLTLHWQSDEDNRETGTCHVEYRRR